MRTLTTVDRGERFYPMPPLGPLFPIAITRERPQGHRQPRGACRELHVAGSVSRSAARGTRAMYDPETRRAGTNAPKERRARDLSRLTSGTPGQTSPTAATLRAKD